MSAAPWTRSEEAALVAKAIRFIIERVQQERLEFCLEVGGHLFEGLFKGSVALYRKGGRWKERSLAKIARDPRVELSDQQLANCVRIYLAVRQFGRTAPGLDLPELKVWEWGSLFFPLEHDPGSLVEIALWAERENVPVAYLRTTAQLVKPYLAAGGKLDDLLSGADTSCAMMMRILGVVKKRIRDHGLPAIAHARTVEILQRMLGLLDRQAIPGVD